MARAKVSPIEAQPEGSGAPFFLRKAMMVFEYVVSLFVCTYYVLVLVASVTLRLATFSLHEQEALISQASIQSGGGGEARASCFGVRRSRWRLHHPPRRRLLRERAYIGFASLCACTTTPRSCKRAASRRLSTPSLSLTSTLRTPRKSARTATACCSRRCATLTPLCAA